MDVTINHYLVVACILFCIGLVLVLTRRNAIMVLGGLELMFNAANINLVAFGSQNPGMEGQMFALFVIVIAACETAVALGLLMHVYNYLRTANLDEMSTVKE